MKEIFVNLLCAYICVSGTVRGAAPTSRPSSRPSEIKFPTGVIFQKELPDFGMVRFRRDLGSATLITDGDLKSWKQQNPGRDPATMKIYLLQIELEAPGDYRTSSYVVSREVDYGGYFWGVKILDAVVADGLIVYATNVRDDIYVRFLKCSFDPVRRDALNRSERRLWKGGQLEAGRVQPYVRGATIRVLPGKSSFEILLATGEEKTPRFSVEVTDDYKVKIDRDADEASGREPKRGRS